jgi:peroxiredoxin
VKARSLGNIKMQPDQVIDHSRGISRWLLALVGLLSLLLIISVAGNFVLASRLRQSAADMLAKRNPPSLQPGTRVPAIAGRDLRNEPQKIEVAGVSRPTLLYVFTPSCGWCTKNLDNIKALARHAEAGYRVIGLSLAAGGLGEYMTQTELKFTAVIVPDESTIRAYKMGATPATIVISAGGKVEKSWLGAYAEGADKEIEAYFGLHLPGLTKARGRAGEGH